MASTAVRSKGGCVVVDSLFIAIIIVVGFCVESLFYCAMFSVCSSYSIICIGVAPITQLTHVCK